jgi:hypothetical protein
VDLGDVGCGDIDWIGLAQDRNRWRAPVNSVMNLRVRETNKWPHNWCTSRVVLSCIESVLVSYLFSMMSDVFLLIPLIESTQRIY